MRSSYGSVRRKKSRLPGRVAIAQREESHYTHSCPYTEEDSGWWRTWRREQRRRGDTQRSQPAAPIELSSSRTAVACGFLGRRCPLLHRWTSGQGSRNRRTAKASPFPPSALDGYTLSRIFGLHTLGVCKS